MKLIEKKWLDIVAGGVCQCTCRMAFNESVLCIGDRKSVEDCRESCKDKSSYIKMVYESCEDIIIMSPERINGILTGRWISHTLQ
jgi:hypothetical protein